MDVYQLDNCIIDTWKFDARWMIWSAMQVDTDKRLKISILCVILKGVIIFMPH